MHPQSTLVQLPLFVLDKRCSKCEQTKPLEQFRRNKRTKDGLYAWCNACSDAYRIARYSVKGDALRANARAYYQEHREERLAYKHAYDASHREVLAARAQAYNVAHPEKRKEQWQRWYAAHHEQQLARGAAYYAQHRQDRRLYRQTWWPRHYTEHAAQYRQRTAAWQDANPERYRARRRLDNARRRQRAGVAAGVFTAEDIRALEVAQAGLCPYCDAPYGAYHVDHKVPIVRGGTNWPDNLCLTCAACNLSKGAKTDGEFREWLALRASNVRCGNRIG